MFGTFGMLGIASAYYAVPLLRGVKSFDQRLGRVAFWLVLTGMLGIAFAFAIGGTIQVFLYRSMGLNWFGGEVFPAMQFYKVLIPIFGLVFAVGTGLLVYDLLTLGLRQPSAVVPEPRLHAAPRGGWGSALKGSEASLWLMGMWIFGAIITMGLLSFNLDAVSKGDPTIPYVLAGIGYPGLLLITLLFVWRFLASLQARPQPAAAPEASPAMAQATS
jgi:nitric oxide reductase subunit B